MFSVIIPMYNSENTIAKVLDSVREQTRVDLVDEIIIVNDGSTDNSENIVTEYQKKHTDMPIQLIHQDNAGCSAARNTGMRRAVGEWIALLDSDDTWISEKLEIQEKVIEENPDILFLGAATEEGPFSILGKKYCEVFNASAKELSLKSFPQTSTVVFKRAALSKIGYFNENMRYCEDINFYQKFLIYFDNYYFLPKKLVNFGFAKKFYGDSGLSSHLYKMHRGRCRNTKELYLAHKISLGYYMLMQVFNWVKLLRRSCMRKLESYRNSHGQTKQDNSGK